MFTIQYLTAVPLAAVPLAAITSLSHPAVYGATVPTVAQDSEQPELSSTEWITQRDPVQASDPVQITAVRLESTEAGLEILLETVDGELAPPTTTISGNALIVDIPDAVLRLPEGSEFQQFEPSEDIALISGSNQPNNHVQLVITGVTAPPLVDIQTASQGLALIVKPGTELDTATLPNNALQVIVTAEKTPEEAQDVPLSLTVLTEQDIEDTDTTSIEDIAGNVPNFVLFSGEAASSPFYSIRGIGNFNFLSREAVAFYVDDVPYDRIGFVTTDLPDIAQVEVLRGPQSTLYGRNALSGVVNITTRRPTEEFEFDTAASYGNFDAADLRVGVSGPLADQDVFFRLSGQFFSRDGYIENSLLDDDVDERESLNGRAQVLWTPSDQWEISFNAFLEDVDSNTNLIVVSEFDPSEAFDIESDVDNSFERKSDTQSLRIAYTNPNFRATSITSRRFSSSEQRADGDGSPLDIIVNTNDFTGTVWSQELRFQSPEDAGRFEWIAGGYFESNEFLNENDGFTFGADAASIGFPVGADLNDGELNETIWAGFAQVSYRPINPLTLTAGVRFESFDSLLERLESTFTPPGGPPLTTFSIKNIEQDTDIWLPRFVVAYRPNSDFMVYGSMARGYRPGGVNFRGDETTLLFEEERAWNYEIGVKSSWLDDRLGANLALFHTDVDDYQVLVNDSLNIGRIDNTDVSITGAELELRANPLRGLDLIAGLGISDATFSESGSFDGNQVPFAPRLNYNLALQYRTRGGFFARAELQGIGKTFFNEDNSLEQDAYAIVNARLGYEFNNTGIYVFANNIFDTEYFAQAFDFQPLGSLVTPGAPTTVGVQVRQRF